MKPSTEFRLPIELLSSIFELVPPEVLAVLTRCHTCFYELCNPLLYREVHLHTPPQLVLLLESQKAIRMLGSTESLTVDEFTLYLEAWDGIDIVDSNPLRHLIRVLYATTSLRSLKVTKSGTSNSFSKRSNLDDSNELLRIAGDPKFLPKLTLISVFNSSDPYQSWLEKLCYGRVVKSYSIWTDTNIHMKIFPELERSEVTTPDPHPSSFTTSPPSCYPKQFLSGGEVGRLIQQSVDAQHRLNITSCGLLLEFPKIVLHEEPPHIHGTYSWLKDVLVAAEFPQLQSLYARFQFLPSDWAISLHAQRSGLEELQTVAPKLVAVGLSSTKIFWKKWVPSPGEIVSYPAVPHWTPCPAVDMSAQAQDTVRDMLLWWLDALGLDILGIQDRRVMKDFANALWVAMHERWEVVAPSETTLYNRLLSLF
ncbi:hypothetical protein RSOLAG1IB_04820 [Rhizoctonia solani AG-1 IB]|uniref:F-box domain-containing protein n=1 Tax=Thanatephorus cucumeris (strain AG1-IB / isolate 7/3/14) TaxID=1108050 RepID=A0A0B7G038_THACB|nr:hypothetical protein RSOLAG1IB_04820 [Rhizoctonia solani AG-1 IB]